jgi:hypothetical protein
MILWERPGFTGTPNFRLIQTTSADGSPILLVLPYGSEAAVAVLTINEALDMASAVIDACTAHRVA